MLTENVATIPTIPPITMHPIIVRRLPILQPDYIISIWFYMERDLCLKIILIELDDYCYSEA